MNEEGTPFKIVADSTRIDPMQYGKTPQQAMQEQRAREAMPQTAETDTNFAQNKAAPVGTEPIQAGRATTIQNPYEGKTPVKNGKRSVSSVSIPTSAVTEAQKSIDTAAQQANFKGTIKKTLQNIFGMLGGQRKVLLENVSFDGQNYDVSLNPNIAAKVASDKNISAEKLAVFSQLDEAVKSSEYVGSGDYGKKRAKASNVVRYDYFENNLDIGGKPYVMTFDVEVYTDRNNLRTYRVINEIDLTPLDAVHQSLSGSGVRTDSGLSVTSSVSQRLSNGRQMPQATTDDTLVANNIARNTQKVKRKNEENGTISFKTGTLSGNPSDTAPLSIDNISQNQQNSKRLDIAQQGAETQALGQNTEANTEPILRQGTWRQGEIKPKLRPEYEERPDNTWTDYGTAGDQDAVSGLESRRAYLVDVDQARIDALEAGEPLAVGDQVRDARVGNIGTVAAVNRDGTAEVTFRNAQTHATKTVSVRADQLERIAPQAPEVTPDSLRRAQEQREALDSDSYEIPGIIDAKE